MVPYLITLPNLLFIIFIIKKILKKQSLYIIPIYFIALNLSATKYKFLFALQSIFILDIFYTILKTFQRFIFLLVIAKSALLN